MSREIIVDQQLDADWDGKILPEIGGKKNELACL